MPLPKRVFAVPSVLAAFSMTAMPLAAADIAAPAHRSTPADAAWSEAVQTAHQYRRDRWGRGWDRHRHRHRDRGVDAGDVIAGVLILGGIAAIVNAVKNDRERDRRERDVQHPDNRYPDDRGTGWDRHGGLDNAAALCADEVEREAQVDRVDTVDRTAQGWEVRGTLADGAGFICRIGPDGRTVDVDYSLRRDRPVYRDSADDYVRD